MKFETRSNIVESQQRLACLQDCDGHLRLLPFPSRFRPFPSRLRPLCSRLRPLLLLLLALCSPVYSARDLGKVTPTDPNIAVGETLELNCTLTGYNTSVLNSSSLYFRFQPKRSNPPVIPRSYQRAISPTVLQYRHPNMSEEWAGIYWCYINESSIQGRPGEDVHATFVSVGRIPSIPSLSVVSDNLENMTVRWCDGFDPDGMVKYTLDWSIDDYGRPLTGQCSIWAGYSPPYVLPALDPPEGCSCVFCGTSLSGPCMDVRSKDFHQYFTYTVNVTGRNAYGSTSASITFSTDASIAKPRPVRSLAVKVVSSRALDISWKPPANYYEELYYKVSFKGEWDSEATVREVGNKTSLGVYGLDPFTCYAVKVWCKPPGEGYWSDETATVYRTPEDGPGAPPGGVCVTGVTSGAVSLAWNPSPAPNGFVTHYVFTSTFDSTEKIETIVNAATD